MPLWNPYAVRDPSFLDRLPPAPSPLRVETAMPDSFTLQRMGLRVETEPVSLLNRGEVITTRTGDYVQRAQRVVTPSESYDIVVTLVDVGAGSQALQVVQTPAVAGESWVQPDLPVSETVVMVNPYTSYETGSIATVVPVPVEAQQATGLYIDPSTYNQFGFDTGTPAVVDPSVYAQFGFDTGPTTVTLAPDPALLHPESFL